MPTITLKGNLIFHFAAYKKHIGVFGASGAVERFKNELSIYAGPKGNLKFPIDKPLPPKLIRKIVKFRVAENLKKGK